MPGFTPIATPGGGPGAIRLNQDASISVSKPDAGDIIDVPLRSDRYGFLHIVNGSVEIDGKTYSAGDGLAFEGTDVPFAITGVLGHSLMSAFVGKADIRPQVHILESSPFQDAIQTLKGGVPIVSFIEHCSKHVEVVSDLLSTNIPDFVNSHLTTERILRNFRSGLHGSD